VRSGACEEKQKNKPGWVTIDDGGVVVVGAELGKFGVQVWVDLVCNLI
jgi:hypothetical protein